MLAAHAPELPRINRAQVALTTAAVRWYLDRYYGTPDDPGLLPMFCDPRRVGHFAAAPDAVRAGEPRALFRVLVTAAMFQRQRDAQVSAILRGIPPASARELTSAARLNRLAASSGCPHLASAEALDTSCDLTKVGGVGTCSAQPTRACALKEHTVLLRRYGHFGKMPTSAALVVQESGVRGLRALHAHVCRGSSSPLERAQGLEQQLTRIWRISDKLAAMYLSALTNPDLGGGLAPWTEGIAWTHFVVIDSNVDLFLRALRFEGPWTYSARREFIQRLALRIDLSALGPGLQPYNPRLVQQAMYLFMSSSNRRASAADCSRNAPAACAVCPQALRSCCAFAPTA